MAAKDAAAAVFPARAIVDGIDTHPDPQEHSNVWELLKLPFLKYRSPVGAKFISRE